MNSIVSSGSKITATFAPSTTGHEGQVSTCKTCNVHPVSPLWGVCNQCFAGLLSR